MNGFMNNPIIDMFKNPMEMWSKGFDQQNWVDLSGKMMESMSWLKSVYNNDPNKTPTDMAARYAENLKKMIQTANKNQEALLDIINKIFVYTVDPQTIKKQIRINPLLTEQGLQDIVVETRALIIKLYLSCEMDYVNGLKMYEAIVEQKILETAQSQINNLTKMSDQLITVDSVPVPAEVKQIKEKIEEKINEKKEDIEKQAIDIKKDEAKIEAEVPPVIQA